MEVEWPRVASALSGLSVSGAFVIGSAAHSDACRLAPGADVDLVIIVGRPSRDTLEAMKGRLSSVIPGPNGGVAIEFRHGPYKHPGLCQFHCLVHTSGTLLRVPLVTRMDWTIGSRSLLGGSPPDLLGTKKVPRRSLLRSFLDEVERLLSQTATSEAKYREWLWSQPPRLAVRSHRLSSGQEEAAFYRHVVRASVADATVACGRRERFNVELGRAFLERNAEDCLEVWSAMMDGAVPKKAAVIGHLLSLRAWGRDPTRS